MTFNIFAMGLSVVDLRISVVEYVGVGTSDAFKFGWPSSFLKKLKMVKKRFFQNLKSDFQPFKNLSLQFT